MKTFIAIVMALGVLAVGGFAQPVCPTGTTASFCVAQVSNAASEALPPLQNSSIAQGSYFSIYGNGLAANVSTCGAGYVNCLWPPSFPLPTAVQGTSVAVTVGGTTTNAFVEFAAQVTSTLAQINAVLPSTTPVGTGTLTVSYNGTQSNAFPITVVPSSFGTFALNQAGTGPGVITDASYKALTPFHTATPGEAVILWGTGLGPAPDPATEQTAGPCPNGCDLRGPNLSVTVWVGNQQASVAYAGRATGYTAEDEIVFTVPTSVQPGCYVSVAVQAGPPSGTEVISNFTSMTVDPNGAPCQDADGINMNDIASVVTSKGQANVAAISLLSNYLNLSVGGVLSLQWDNDTLNGEIGTFNTTILDEFQGFTLVPSVGDCTVSPFLQYPPPVDPLLAAVTYLDAGADLTIQAPSGSPVSVPKNTNGKGYSFLVGGSTIANLLSGGGINPYYLNSTGWGGSSWTYAINSGTYTVAGTGGTGSTAVGAFSTTIPVSSAAASFVWTNQAAVTGSPIPRTSPLTISWTGGDPNGFVDITAISSTLQSGITPLASTPGILVECIVPAQLGTYTIPTYILQSLPSTVSSKATVPPGELLVGPASGAVPFSTLPTGLDAGYLFYHFIEGSNVSWQ